MTNDREALKRILYRFKGIADEDLTVAEKQVIDIAKQALDHTEECPNCNGHKHTYFIKVNGNYKLHQGICPKCDGTGKSQNKKVLTTETD